MASRRTGVATPAGVGVVCRRAVRIVARGAGHGAFALQEALRFAKPVRGAVHNLKLVVVARAARVVEDKLKVRERFSGLKGKRSSIEAADPGRQIPTGGLEVALLADIHLPRRCQPRRIKNTRPDFGWPGPFCLRGAHVVRSVAVTSLAIDPFW